MGVADTDAVAAVGCAGAAAGGVGGVCVGLGGVCDCAAALAATIRIFALEDAGLPVELLTVILKVLLPILVAVNDKVPFSSVSLNRRPNPTDEETTVAFSLFHVTV